MMMMMRYETCSGGIFSLYCIRTICTPKAACLSRYLFMCKCSFDIYDFPVVRSDKKYSNIKHCHVERHLSGGWSHTQQNSPHLAKVFIYIQKNAFLLLKWLVADFDKQTLLLTIYHICIIDKCAPCTNQSNRSDGEQWMHVMHTWVSSCKTSIEIKK